MANNDPAGRGRPGSPIGASGTSVGLGWPRGDAGSDGLAPGEPHDALTATVGVGWPAGDGRDDLSGDDA
jgi:hypothetical protein